MCVVVDTLDTVRQIYKSREEYALNRKTLRVNSDIIISRQGLWCCLYKYEKGLKEKFHLIKCIKKPL